MSSTRAVNAKCESYLLSYVSNRHNRKVAVVIRDKNSINAIEYTTGGTSVRQ